MLKYKIFTVSAFIMLIVTVVFGEAYPAYTYEKTESRKVPLGGAEALQVSCSECDVVVTGDDEGKDIRVEVLKVVKAENEDKARKLAGEMKLEVTRKGRIIKLEVKYPHEKADKTGIFDILLNLGPRMRMDLEIFIPRSLAVSVMTASGDVELYDLTQNCEVSTASGDVVAEDIAGNLSINVSSGDVEVKNTGSIFIDSASGDISAKKVNGKTDISVTAGDIELVKVVGDLNIKTLAGDIYAENVEGDASVKGTSGSIEFIDVMGSVDAFTASGDVYIMAVPSSDEVGYNLGTSNGSVELTFKEILKGGYVLRASTTTGEIGLDLPIDLSNLSRNNISGVVREGRSKVIIETASGDILIKE